MGEATPAVVVLDGEQRAALAVVRSLGRRGCRVHVGSAMPRSLAGGSRFATSESLLPDPLGNARSYTEAVARLLAASGSTVVVPVAEASTLALLESADLLAGIRVPTSDLAHFRWASDKAAVLSLANNLGIAVPAQWAVAGKPGEELSIPGDRFPVVVKPARSVVSGQDGRIKVGVRYAKSAADLAQILREFGEAAGPFLVQEKIDGPGVGVFMLRWGGQVIATFAHRRIREKPPSGGVSVCSESVEAPPALLAQSAKLLDGLEWAGVAMIEYKHDNRSGRDYLMEINPRFWGSLQLAVDAGIDFPWYLLQAVLGHPVSVPAAWPVGIRSRWCWGEIDHLIARLRRSRADLNLTDEAPGLLSTIVSVLTPWRPGQRNDVLRLSDPKPAFRETIEWFRELA